MLIEIIWKHWAIFGVAIIGLPLAIYALNTRKASRSLKSHNAGIFMLIISLFGIYFGFFQGIVNQKISVAVGSRHSFNTVQIYGTDALITGVLLTFASIAFLVFGVIAIRMSKDEDHQNKKGAV